MPIAGGDPYSNPVKNIVRNNSLESLNKDSKNKS